MRLCYNHLCRRPWRYRLGVRTEDSQSSNTGSIPVSATNKSEVQRNPSRSFWKSRKMAAILRFFPSNRTRENLFSTPEAGLGAFFSGGQTRSPVSTTPAGECNAITNRWCSESALTFRRLSGIPLLLFLKYRSGETAPKSTSGFVARILLHSFRFAPHANPDHGKRQSRGARRVQHS